MSSLTQTEKTMDRILGQGKVADLKLFGLLMVAASILRCAVSTGSYSGEAYRPFPHIDDRVQKWGDFECHRTWIEITQNLDISQWYENTPHSNTTYWPLDYPPLCARYH